MSLNQVLEDHKKTLCCVQQDAADPCWLFGFGHQRPKQAFLDLKAKFSKYSVLAYPDPNLPFIAEVDALDTALGTVLAQKQSPEGLLHPCAFYFRQLMATEYNYAIWEQELRANKVAFEM